VTFYPTASEAIAAHARLIARFGGSPGLRDRGALEAALSRPQTGYYVDLIQEAAALWESLSQNHPFVDGNKRVAITVAAAFLEINGFRLEFDDFDAYRFIIDLYGDEDLPWRLVYGPNASNTFPATPPLRA
jgi:death on curing protein